MSTPSGAKNKYVTIEEYLQLEEYSQVKHEYLGGSIVEMPGAKYGHNIITSNINATLWQALSSAEDNCKVLSSDMKVLISPHNNILYPDLSIVCGDPVFFMDRKDVLTNPKVIIEVLSESTQAYDRGEKFEQYSSIESMKEYVLVTQDHALVEVFTSIDIKENSWKINRYHHLEEKALLRSLGVSISLYDIYRHIEFSDIQK